MIQIDMRKPNVCGECPFSDYTTREYPYCLVLKADRGYPFDVNKKRFPNCPLEEADGNQENEKEEEMERRKDICRVLFNRCRAVLSSGGMMCTFCGMRKECEEEHSL